MKNEDGLKLRLETNMEHGFPVGCHCPDCENDSCGTWIFKCVKFTPDSYTDIVIMTMSQLQNFVDKYINSTIFDSEDGYYLKTGGIVIYVPKTFDEEKNHSAV